MKINKNLIMLILLLIFCISISTVSAADSIDIQVDDVKNVNLEVVDASSQNDVKINNLQAGEGSFKELQGEIDNAIEGATIILTKNYKFSGTNDNDSIVINKNLIIDGNGHTIDASNSTRFFVLNKSNIIIKNIKFINAYSEAGAISCFGYKDIITNCTFTNCRANVSGGAIYWIGDMGTVSGCSFERCTAGVSGGVIYFFSGAVNGSVSGCNFTKCSAKDTGGAIYLDKCDDTIINNCVFINDSTSHGAGAIYYGHSPKCFN